MRERETKRRLAARLLGRGKTVPEVAEAIGATVRTVFYWKADPAFQALVVAERNAWRPKANAGGIADIDWVLRHQQDRHKRMRAIVLARARDPEHRKAPGGDTGMLTIAYKMQSLGEGLGSEARAEYAFDAALNEAMIEVEREVQIHLGKYKVHQVVDHTGSVEIYERLRMGRDRVAAAAKLLHAPAAASQPK